MSLVTIDELTDVQLDVLREIGNIGQGNAATSLSAFSGGCVNIAVPDVSVLGVSEVMEFMGGPDEVVAGIMVRMTGAVCGMMLTILRRDFVTKMVDTVFDHRVEDFGELNDIERSFVEEIGNILSGSYLNAICELSGLSADVSVPAGTYHAQHILSCQSCIQLCSRDPDLICHLCTTFPGASARRSFYSYSPKACCPDILRARITDLPRSDPCAHPYIRGSVQGGLPERAAPVFSDIRPSSRSCS